jgi:hypothetical protein
MIVTYLTFRIGYNTLVFAELQHQPQRADLQQHTTVCHSQSYKTSNFQIAATETQIQTEL